MIGWHADHLNDARELDVIGMVKGQCHTLYRIFREDFFHYVCLAHSPYFPSSGQCSSLALYVSNVELPIPRCTAMYRIELLWTFVLPARHPKFKILSKPS